MGVILSGAGPGRAARSPGRARAQPQAQSAVLAALVGTMVAIGVCAGAAALAQVEVEPAVRVAGVASGLVLPVGVALALLRRPSRRCGPADLVTLARSVIAGGAATLVLLALAGGVTPRSWELLALVVPALLLDAADGAVARATGTSSRAGARLDMECDAAFLLVLSLAAAVVVGWWALLIGAMRYAFAALGCLRPAWRAPLPYSLFRRVVAGTQGAALALALAPVVPPGVAVGVVALALALLVVSFGRDVVSLERLARDGKPPWESVPEPAPRP